MFNSNFKDQILEFNRVELWPEPRKDVEGGEIFESEMSREDHAFLCGIIRKVQPKKILEIGVAEGGTTSIIMHCLSLLNLHSEVYSVDLSEELYLDNKKKTGYIYEGMRNCMKGSSTHEFMFGKTIAGYIDKIGTDIDLVIIDTTHTLPGEILDFLCVLPYLSQNAMVVLHDISVEYIRYFSEDITKVLRAKEANATKILFTTVTAKKYFGFDGYYESGYNIAAFSINEDTIKYIRDCFQVLNMTWEYGLSDVMANEYRSIITRYYNKECVKLFDVAVETNKIMTNRRHLAEKEFCFDKMERYAHLSEEKIEKLKCAENIIVYGAGIVAIEVIKILEKADIKITAVAVSNEEKNVKKLCGIEVKAISKLLNYRNGIVIISSTSDKFVQEIEEILRTNHFQNIMKVDCI